MRKRRNKDLENIKIRRKIKIGRKRSFRREREIEIIEKRRTTKRRGINN